MTTKKCEPGCTCGKHSRIHCTGPGCTCHRHRPSEATKARLRGMAANRLGAKSTDEHRRRISAALTGRPLSDEHRAKMAAINADPELLKKKAKSRKARRKTPETYRQVHKRLYSDRGSASSYRCVDCDSRADDWSHNWPTWEDVAQDIRAPRGTFSTNLDAYVPRCTPCHARLDHAPTAWNHGGGRRACKLTPTDVVWIRTSRMSAVELARLLGVSQTTVRDARRGKTWRYLNSVATLSY